jgi:hypothetical protein
MVRDAFCCGQVSVVADRNDRRDREQQQPVARRFGLGVLSKELGMVRLRFARLGRTR